jgi:hypothetical protein
MANTLFFSACKMQFEGLCPCPQCFALKGLDSTKCNVFSKVGHVK